VQNVHKTPVLVPPANQALFWMEMIALGATLNSVVPLQEHSVLKEVSPLVAPAWLVLPGVNNAEDQRLPTVSCVAEALLRLMADVSRPTWTVCVKARR